MPRASHLFAFSCSACSSQPQGKLQKAKEPLSSGTCVELFLVLESLRIHQGAPGYNPGNRLFHFYSQVSELILPWPALKFVEYLHSLVIHSESSRQEDPMGLRETPLQNGVILRDLLFVELSSSTGEPSACRAKN